MKTTPRLLLFVAWTLAAGSAATAAPSAKKDEAKSQFDKAEISYKLGRFQEALDAYSRAYEIFQAPALLFNIGQCHRNLRNYDRAIFSFESFLREETNPSRRKLAQQLIAELRTELANAKERGATPAPPPEGSQNPQLPQTPSAAVEPAPVAKPLAMIEPPPSPADPAPALIAAPASSDDRPADQPLTRKWWFWTAIGAGVLAVAAGAFVYYESGTTKGILPGGTIGTLDRR